VHLKKPIQSVNVNVGVQVKLLESAIRERFLKVFAPIGENEASNDDAVTTRANGGVQVG